MHLLNEKNNGLKSLIQSVVLITIFFIAFLVIWNEYINAEKSIVDQFVEKAPLQLQV